MRKEIQGEKNHAVVRENDVLKHRWMDVGAKKEGLGIRKLAEGKVGEKYQIEHRAAVRSLPGGALGRAFDRARARGSFRSRATSDAICALACHNSPTIPSV